MASLIHVREPRNAETNRRRVIITKRYNVIGSEELRAHPRVRKYWELPRDYCLIEIRDWVAQPLDSATSHEVAVARMDEAAIFAPFYHSIKSIAEIMTLHVPLPTTVYHLVTDRKSVSRWPQFCFSKEWETSSILHTACRLNSNSGEELAVTQASITEWATAMIQAGVLRVFGPLGSEFRKYAVTCEFSEASGDPAMALFMVLTDAMSAYHLRSVSFRVPKGSLLSSVKPRQKANGKTNGAGDHDQGDGRQSKVVLICSSGCSR